MTSCIYCKCYWELRCTKMGKYTVQSGKWSAIRYQSETNRFCKKGVLKDIAKFTGEQLHQRLFLNKVAGLRPATLFKKRLWHRCFPVNFAKFLRTLFFIEHLPWLPLTGIVFFSASLKVLAVQKQSSGGVL